MEMDRQAHEQVNNLHIDIYKRMGDCSLHVEKPGAWIVFKVGIAE